VAPYVLQRCKYKCQSELYGYLQSRIDFYTIPTPSRPCVKIFNAQQQPKCDPARLLRIYSVEAGKQGGIAKRRA